MPWGLISVSTGRRTRQTRLLRNIRNLEDKSVDETLVQGRLSSDITENEDILRGFFHNCSDVVFRQIQSGHQLVQLIVYVQGLVDTQQLDQILTQPLREDGLNRSENISVMTKSLLNQLTAATEIKQLADIGDVVACIMAGEVAILSSNDPFAFVLHIGGSPGRGVEEPMAEQVIRGPREGFTESLVTNTSLLRKRVKSHFLKIESYELGKISHTNVAVAYIDKIVDGNVLEEVRRRVSRIDVDAILDTGFIEEFIEDVPFSPFPQIQNTERPDVVLANILEGKVAIISDGSPFALMVPLTFWGSLQSAEDYYDRFIFMTSIRWLRFLLVLMSLLLPSAYVALTTFHPQLIPTNLVLTFAAAREPSPFPAVIEALLMEFVFEALREAGIRLPKSVGSAVSIVGGLVIGQAAVEAGVVSAPMVIVVSTTGIASFAIPRYNFGTAFRLLRFPMLILAGTLGFFGMTIGILTIFIHLITLESFGTPYLSPVAPTDVHHLGDALIRVPRWAMRTRPPLTADEQGDERIPPHQQPSPNK